MWSWVPSMGEKNINSRFHLFDIISWSTSGSPPSLVGKEPACNAGDLGSLPGTGRSPGEGNSNPLQYSCLENPMDRGAWCTIVHGVTRVGHEWSTEQACMVSSWLLKLQFQFNVPKSPASRHCDLCLRVRKPVLRENQITHVSLTC